MFSSKQKKKILYNLPLRPSQVHSIRHDDTVQDPEKSQACTEESFHCGVLGREKLGSGRRKHIWPSDSVHSPRAHSKEMTDHSQQVINSNGYVRLSIIFQRPPLQKIREILF